MLRLYTCAILPYATSLKCFPPEFSNAEREPVLVTGVVDCHHSMLFAFSEAHMPHMNGNERIIASLRQAAILSSHFAVLQRQAAGVAPSADTPAAVGSEGPP